MAVFRKKTQNEGSVFFKLHIFSSCVPSLSLYYSGLFRIDVELLIHSLGRSLCVTRREWFTAHRSTEAQRQKGWAEQGLELLCRNDTHACSRLLPFIKYARKNVVKIRFSCMNMYKSNESTGCPSESNCTKALTWTWKSRWMLPKQDTRQSSKSVPSPDPYSSCRHVPDLKVRSCCKWQRNNGSRE